MPVPLVPLLLVEGTREADCFRCGCLAAAEDDLPVLVVVRSMTRRVAVAVLRFDKLIC